jgi:hypothetical protein
MTRNARKFTTADLQHVQTHLTRFGDIQRLCEKADSPRFKRLARDLWVFKLLVHRLVLMSEDIDKQELK